jgi:hypothetical protein
MRLEIVPRVWEQRRILAAVSSESGEATRTLDPAIHFAMIMDHIEQDAVARGILCPDRRVSAQ